MPSVPGSPAEPEAALQCRVSGGEETRPWQRLREQRLALGRPRCREPGPLCPPLCPGRLSPPLARPPARGKCPLCRPSGPPLAAAPGAPRRQLQAPGLGLTLLSPRPAKADSNTRPESAPACQGQSFLYSTALLSESGWDYKITRRKEHEQVLLWQSLRALRERVCGAYSLTGMHRKC